MPPPKSDLPQGTLDLLVLKVVALGPLHGYGIAHRLQQQITQQLGADIVEHEDAYLGEELLRGKIGGKVDHLSRDLIDPLFSAMRAEKVSVAELESYLYARHAIERNELDRMFARCPELFIQAWPIDAGVDRRPDPYAMFSPTLQLRAPSR